MEDSLQQKVIKAFNKYAKYLEATGGHSHRITSYRRIALVFAELTSDEFENHLRNNTLGTLQYVGKSSVESVKTYLTNGTIKDVEIDKVPDTDDPVITREQPEEFKSGKIGTVRSVVLRLLQEILHPYLSTKLTKWQVCGSYRREETLIDDLTIVCACVTPEEWSNFCLGLRKTGAVPNTWIKEVPTVSAIKASLLTSEKLEINFYRTALSHWGGSLIFHTGSENHLDELREAAKQQDVVLGEYGLSSPSGKLLNIGGTEEEIYSFLKKDFVEPKNR